MQGGGAHYTKGAVSFGGGNSGEFVAGKLIFDSATQCGGQR